MLTAHILKNRSGGGKTFFPPVWMEEKSLLPEKNLLPDGKI